MSSIQDFFIPYVQLSLISAWGIAQNFEGIGVFKYFNESVVQLGGRIFWLLNLSPLVGVTIISIIVSFALSVILVLNVRACFSVGGRAGVASIFIWTMPGLFSMIGWRIDAKWFAPDVFRFAVGFPGGVGSAAINLVISLIAGWSIAILFGRRFDRNNLKNVYDHLWYPLGLVAVLYFVVDSGLPFYKEDATDATQQEIAILKLYRDSVQSLERACAANEYVLANAANLCHLKEEIGSQIAMEIDKKSEIRAKTDLPQWISTLGEGKNPELEREIAFINDWACARGNLRNACGRIPIEQAIDQKDIDKSYVFLPPYYAGALLKIDASFKKVDEHIRSIEMGHNIRYFAFLGVGLLAGGKVANATRAFLADDVAPQKSWIVYSLRGIWWGINLGIRTLLMGARFCRRKFKSYMKSDRSLN
ncbi:hypothetical protein [Burkholderia ubonensis]|uniref:hypothetical protein n=1 Tax=Burkholderia ubonensis TaxID=101571 RepID=UPI000A729A68|nr:hypothetical protein [Burkholderia ubonensis]